MMNLQQENLSISESRMF